MARTTNVRLVPFDACTWSGLPTDSLCVFAHFESTIAPLPRSVSTASEPSFHAKRYTPAIVAPSMPLTGTVLPSTRALSDRTAETLVTPGADASAGPVAASKYVALVLVSGTTT